MMISSRGVALIVAALSVVQGCAPHIVFPRALPRTAPYVDRLAWYERFHTQQRTTIIVMTARGDAPAHHRSTVDDQEVFHSEDLIPLVGRRSRVARHSRAAMRGEIAGGWTVAAGTTALVFGLTTIMTQRTTGISDTAAYGVGGTFMGAGAISLIVGGILRYIAADERGAAFDAFDEDLRRRLGVCQRADLELVDCDQRDAR